MNQSIHSYSYLQPQGYHAQPASFPSFSHPMLQSSLPCSTSHLPPALTHEVSSSVHSTIYSPYQPTYPSTSMLVPYGTAYLPTPSTLQHMTSQSQYQSYTTLPSISSTSTLHNPKTQNSKLINNTLPKHNNFNYYTLLQQSGYEINHSQNPNSSHNRHVHLPILDRVTYNSELATHPSKMHQLYTRVKKQCKEQGEKYIQMRRKQREKKEKMLHNIQKLAEKKCTKNMNELENWFFNSNYQLQSNTTTPALSQVPSNALLTTQQISHTSNSTSDDTVDNDQDSHEQLYDENDDDGHHANNNTSNHNQNESSVASISNFGSSSALYPDHISTSNHDTLYKQQQLELTKQQLQQLQQQRLQQQLKLQHILQQNQKETETSTGTSTETAAPATSRGRSITLQQQSTPIFHLSPSKSSLIPSTSQHNGITLTAAQSSNLIRFS